MRLHPAKVLPPAAITLAGLFLVFVLDTLLPPLPFVRDVLWLAWFGLVAWLAWKLAEWWTDYFIVTDKRVMMTTGLITREINMMPLTKVTDMSYVRPIAGRLLGYGMFVMESAGQRPSGFRRAKRHKPGEAELGAVNYVPEPDLIYLEMCDLMFGPQEAGDAGDGT